MGLFPGHAVVKLSNRPIANQLAKTQVLALTFRNSHPQQSFAAFTQLGSFRNVAQRVEIQVCARQNAGQAGIFGQLMAGGISLKPRQSHRPGWFSYRAHILKQILNRSANLIGANNHQIIQVAATQAESFIPYALNGHALGIGTNALQSDRLTSLNSGAQTARILRLYRNHFHLRHQLLNHHRNASCQTATAHGHKHVSKGRILLNQLQANSALASNHPAVIERRNILKPLSFSQVTGVRGGVVESAAMQNYLATQGAHRVYLNHRGNHWHHNRGRNPHSACRQCHPLGVVTSRGRDHSTGAGSGVELTHTCIGATDLKRVHLLAVFTFNQHWMSYPRTDGRHRLQRRVFGYLIHWRT